VSNPTDSVRVRGDFDAPSRWLWLVKWCVLAAPHYPILILLYLVYPLSTVAANVGVLRWSWRVMNYRFPMNSTDKYPPFTLASRRDYPADLAVDYPERLKRPAVLVKWLLAIPQVLLCWSMEPLLQVLCLIAVLALLFTGTIPQTTFDLLMGMVRWRYRVAAYVSLMRDEYPPFRMDLGGR